MKTITSLAGILAPWLASLVVAPTLFGQEPQRAFEIPRLEAEITVDGRLDEPAWADALVFSLDYETRPGENVTPAAETECRMFYTDTHLMYGCTAYDPEPEKIRANYSDRDEAFGDDSIGLAIDTFNDHNVAFILDVNPFGVQLDRLYIEATESSDTTWDAIWDSAGRLTEDGYEVEAAIPFASLRFPRSTDKQTWGFNFRRYMTRDAFYRFAVVPYDRNDRCRTCQHALITGFENVDPGRNLEITPTLTSLQNSRRVDFPDGPLVSEDPDVEPGLTVNWGVTPNMTLAATLNPDFSQVEADVAQLDINREFAIFFPERRPFFLEGSDYFDTSIDAVYTRTLADPDWGLKLTGKEGKNAVGVFAVRDAVTSLLLPGPESSSFDSLGRESEAAVLRYRRDVGESSTVGALYTDRRAGDYGNQVAGLDARLRLTSSDDLDVQWLHSRTEYPGAVVADNELPTGTLEDSALRARYQHSRRNWNLRATYTDIGDDFRADLGFVPRVGYRQLIAGGGYELFGDDDRWYTSIEFGGDWDRTEKQDGALLEEEWESFAGFVGKRQLTVYAGTGFRDRVFQGVPFHQDFYWAFASIQPRGDLEVGLDLSYGDSIDIRGLRPGEQRRIQPYLDWKPGRHLRLNLSQTRSLLDVDAGRLFTATLTELRTVYQFNRRTFVRLILQASDIERDQDLHADPIDARVEDLFGQLLASYKINPQTAVFLGYTSGYLDLDGSGLTETGNTIFLKLGYNWQP